MTDRFKLRGAMVCCLILPIVLFAGLRGFWPSDEIRYAEVAREMFDRGEFLVLHNCGEVYPDKPPLLFWLSGFFGRFAGWHELAMRLPSVLATAGSAWIVAHLARRLWSEIEGIWAPVVFLTTFMILDMGGRLQLDPLLAFLCLAALDLGMTDAAASPDRRRWRSHCAGLLTGLAILTKGPVALLHVLGSALAFRAAPGRLREFRWSHVRAWIIPSALALAPPLLWVILVTVRVPDIAHDLWFGQHLGRVVAPSAHLRGPLVYFLSMPLQLLPWTPLVLSGLLCARGELARRLANLPFDRGLLGAAFWLLGTVVLFSLLSTKRTLYLLPAYPAAALISSRVLARMLRSGEIGRALGATVPILFLGAFLYAAVYPVFADQVRGVPDLAWRAPLAAAPLLVASLLALRTLKRRNPKVWALSQVGGTWTTACLLAILVAPLVDRIRSPREFALFVAARPERPAMIPCIGVRPQGMRFYGRLPAVDAVSFDSAVTSEGDQFLGILWSSAWDGWSEEERSRYRVLHRQLLGRQEAMLVGVSADITPADSALAGASFLNL